MNIKDYEEIDLSLCSDCGTDLDGEYCHQCKVKWILPKRKNIVVAQNEPSTSEEIKKEIDKDYAKERLNEGGNKNANN